MADTRGGSVDVKVHVPPKRAVAVPMEPGDRIIVRNPEGTQVADLTAVDVETGSAFSQAHTSDIIGSVNATEGDALYAHDGIRLAKIERDDVGMNDLLFAPCTGWLLEPPQFAPEPTGCEEHLTEALAASDARVPAVVETLNCFQDGRVDADDRLDVGPSPAARGDELVVRAESKVVVAVSACAALNPETGINGTERTAIDLVVSDSAVAIGPFPDHE